MQFRSAPLLVVCSLIVICGCRHVVETAPSGAMAASSYIEPTTAAGAAIAGALAAPVIIPEVHDVMNDYTILGRTIQKIDKAQSVAALKERREYLPKLHGGMTVDELGKLMPHNFTRSVRRELRKVDHFTGTLDDYQLLFDKGLLLDVKPPTNQ